MEKGFAHPSFLLPVQNVQAPKPKRQTRARALRLALVALAALSATWTYLSLSHSPSHAVAVPMNAQSVLAHCAALKLTPGPPDDFHSRTVSDRFQKGTKATLIKNATIWTGAEDGHEIVYGDILLDNGIIQQVGEVDVSAYKHVSVLDAAGAWVTPGIVDLHSHLGVYSAPALEGASDGNSVAGLTLPWMRSLDGLNTHDDAYRLSIAGGVTTADVLPGSADAIGGQAFVIKLRPTAERSSSAMLLEPPFTLNGTFVDPTKRPRWRQMKHACGENPSRVYSGTRMDTQWAFRQAYETARLIKEKQDAFCTKAEAGLWAGLGDFPDNLQWEALVDVLRGRVKVQNHCYEAVDFDGMIRLTNEFKFSIATFHHAHEAYLVPDLIKKAYGKPPAIAIFAGNDKYKREAYRGSVFAPRILADNGLDVVMKSDHPVIDSRHLIYEAQQAHYYGLPAHLALASVTTTPTKAMGMEHRIGSLIAGFDADVVVWDSHPLTLGATPSHVFIDGIAQLEKPHILVKPKSFQKVPATPDFEKETKAAIEYEGLPPLEPVKAKSDVVVFQNVGSIFSKDQSTRRITQIFGAASTAEQTSVVVEKGQIVCTGNCAVAQDAEYIDLEGGSITPGFITYGSGLGLSHITDEYSTVDGNVLNPLEDTIPDIVSSTVIKAVDGLLFETRNALTAYHAGVTGAITDPVGGFLTGLGTYFSTGAAHKLSDGAIIQSVTGLHVKLSMSAGASVSTQVAALRRLLLGKGKGDIGEQFSQVTDGKIPLVVYAESADIIATLLVLKKEVEASTGKAFKLTITGATEAHLLAKELGAAGVGIILNPRPFPGLWEQRRVLAGPPLTHRSAIATLVSHNVTVGISTLEPALARGIPFDVYWAGIEADGLLSKAETLALGSSNLETLLGVTEASTDLVARKGGDDYEGKVVAIISARTSTVDLV
ncbi:unnamed protein product [Mycena citricolor]|uniref:Amidohydrolase-related domain-containing protein n=1 Tax=Mycena citricolor TaxID=2018698 RepID=A0AAD2HDP1_9AGAR|nr:unnamed protein product [Mycena citricolor]